MALVSLGATRDYEDPIRATLTQRIIALAEAGERDPERLCESALRTIRTVRQHVEIVLIPVAGWAAG